MKKNLLFIIVLQYFTIPDYCYSQPYLDIAKINYLHTPKKGFNHKSNPLLSDFYSINVTLPVELRKGGDAFVINPFFDHNQGTVSNRSFHVVSQGLAAGFLKKFNHNEWSLLPTFILRRNKEAGKKVNDLWQYGGALLATWKKNPSVSFKLGLYYNKEFFGNFFMPLAGIDWKIDSKNNLFGVLPGNMVFEHKVSKNFYWGAAFRALTNSYRLQTTDPCISGDCSGKNYLRVNDNQLELFADTYITPKIIFSAEAGYTAFRKYRFGFRGKILHNYTDLENDNFYIRTSLAYRLRFR